MGFQVGQYFLLVRILEASSEAQYDQFKKVYADILYRWDLLHKRSEVLKYVSTPAEPHKGLGTCKLYQ